VRRVIELVPELEPLSPPPGLAAAELNGVLVAFENLIPLWHEPARETQRRNAIVRLQESATDPGWYRSLMIELAKSNLESGVPDRAALLLSTAGSQMGPELKSAVAEFERAYGSRAGLITEIDRWVTLEGDARGRSLVTVLEHRREELEGRSVIHVSPEATTRAWFLQHREHLGGEYRTLDPFDPSVDLHEDLTALSLPSESCDYILCHRVLEHVLDDRAAMAEMHRILRPGGLLNVSVPMGVQMERTNEWLIRDHSHDGHVRHYGRDFEQRLRDNGFAVELDQTMLARTLEDHLAASTYPMRVYICSR
jgi:SAM-dependent methyltransferase